MFTSLLIHSRRLNHSVQQRPILTLLLFASVFTSAVLVTYIYHFLPNSDGFKGFSNDPGHWGEFGDYLSGTLNPIFSLLALVFLAKTYFAQKEDLDETKRLVQAQAETQHLAEVRHVLFEMLARLDARFDAPEHVSRNHSNRKTEQVSQRLHRIFTSPRIRQEVISIALHLDISHISIAQRAILVRYVLGVLNTKRRRELARISVADIVDPVLKKSVNRFLRDIK